MKKNLLILALLFASTTAVQAQLLKLGVKGGINYANETGTNITVNSSNYKKEAITSYHLGLIAELPLGKKFSLQPELLYSTVGANYKVVDAGQDFKNDKGYISIPVLAKIYMNKTFSLELGPQASFLLSNKKDFNFNDTKTFDFGLAAGLGIKVTEKIFVQGRYVVGLTEASSQAKAKNSVLQVSAGFLF
jgi:hypothetical protein